MRILAIRGRDLASLAGPFEVDLTAPPLAEAGLFAIVGPTGAGKSTLLDALCLALFDRTPRLQGRGAPVGFLLESDRARLRSGDPRVLLRRGASEASAEVEFEGQDGRRWRATWQVRRARRQSAGRLQDATLALVDVETGEARGGTKSETLAAIEQALGLDYAAFCRSVLLAQGEFAAFLRARPDERAALLERMTGSDLYGRLSIAAHQRAAEERARLELLEARLAAVVALPPAERQALSHELAQLRQRLQEAQRAREEAARAVTWHQRARRLRERLEGARASHAARAAAWEDASARRAELAATEAAEPFRLPVAACERAAGEVARAEAQLAAHLALAARAAAAEEAAERALAQAAAERARAQAEAAARGPELAAARRLDVELEAAARRADEEARAAAAAAQDASEAARALTALEQAAAEAQARASAARAALAAPGAAAVLSAQWPRWRAVLERGREAHEARQAAAAALEGTAAESARAARGLERAARQEALARREAAAAEDALRAASAAAPEAGERERLEARLRTLARLGEVARRRAAALARGRAAQAEREAAEASASAAEAAGAAARAQAARLEAGRAEAARARAAARAAAGFDGARAQLVPGEPCALCGATEHPYLDGDGAAGGEPGGPGREFARFAAELEARVSALAREERGARERALSEAARALHARERAGAARERAAQASAEAEQAQADWTELGGQVRGPEGAALEPDDAEALAAREREAEAGLARARAAEGALLAAREARDRTAAGQARASEALRAAELLAAEVQTRRQEADAALAAARRAGEAVERELAEAFEEGDAWGEWREALGALPRTFIALVRGRVARRQADERALATAEAASHELRPRLEAARARALELERAAEAAGARASAQAAARARLAGERAELLEGAPADAVEARLLAARAASEAREGEAREALAGARQQAAAARARVVEGEGALARARADAEAARRELAGRLEVAGLDEARVRERLARGEAWRAAERAALEALERARLEAQRELVLLAGQLAEHEADDPPALEAGEASQTLHAAQGEVAEADRERVELEARLRADDQALAARAELQPALAAQGARREVWAALGELIGSHDGKKLRVFAQSLTLGLVLQEANGALERLAPRYRLERVPGEDLELQVVDHDLGDEVRPLSSLSGGETFLVSLALALGLAALAAGTARIASLFIDEGFGSLDPDAQEVALAALDALQASGRQVALISHVPGIAERVGVVVRVEPRGRGRSVVRAELATT